MIQTAKRDVSKFKEAFSKPPLHAFRHLLFHCRPLRRDGNCKCRFGSPSDWRWHPTDGVSEGRPPWLGAQPARLSLTDKLKPWYRIYDGPDETVGPMVAGRLVGTAAKLATNLKLPRPHDNGYDVGSDALVRLSVEEVRDPMNPELIIQAHIPLGVQALCNALRDAYGYNDQDLMSKALGSSFEFRRGKLSFQEFNVEWALKYDAAENRGQLQLNDVAKFYLWFKASMLPNKFVEDIKLQVRGDLTRFNETRYLALPISQRGEELPGVFHEIAEEDGAYHAWNQDEEWSWRDDARQDFWADGEEIEEWQPGDEQGWW